MHVLLRAPGSFLSIEADAVQTVWSRSQKKDPWYSPGTGIQVDSPTSKSINYPPKQHQVPWGGGRSRRFGIGAAMILDSRQALEHLRGPRPTAPSVWRALPTSAPLHQRCRSTDRSTNHRSRESVQTTVESTRSVDTKQARQGGCLAATWQRPPSPHITVYPSVKTEA